MIKRKVKKMLINIPYDDRDEEEDIEDEENINPDKYDDDDRAYDAMVDEQLTKGE